MRIIFEVLPRRESKLLVSAGIFSVARDISPRDGRLPKMIRHQQPLDIFKRQFTALDHSHCPHSIARRTPPSACYAAAFTITHAKMPIIEHIRLEDGWSPHHNTNATGDICAHYTICYLPRPLVVLMLAHKRLRR